MVAVGSFGCAQQQLGGGPGADAGCGPPGKMVCTVADCTTTTTVAPVCVNGSWTCPSNVGLTISCEPPVCPASLSPGCTCDPATGVTTCRDAGATCPAGNPDGSVFLCVSSCTANAAFVSTCDGGVWSCPPGTMDLRDCSRDAGACPSRERDGGIIGCDCGSDTGPEPTCVNGAWTCGPAAGPATLCTSSPPRCFGTPTPLGCFCNPITGVLTCQRDAGTDGAVGGHGG
jgi:hypothetical protein